MLTCREGSLVGHSDPAQNHRAPAQVRVDPEDSGLNDDDDDEVLIPLLGFLVVQMVKNLPETQETRVQTLGREDPLEEGTATHSSVLAWRILWTEEPVLCSMGCSPWLCLTTLHRLLLYLVPPNGFKGFPKAPKVVKNLPACF